MKETANRFLKDGNADAALTLLLVLLEETSEGMELIDDSDGYFSGFVAELAEPLAKATRRADLSMYARERLVRRLAKVADHLKGYEMDDVVDASRAINAASGKQKVAAHDNRQHRKTKQKHK